MFFLTAGSVYVLHQTNYKVLFFFISFQFDNCFRVTINCTKRTYFSDSSSVGNHPENCSTWHNWHWRNSKYFAGKKSLQALKLPFTFLLSGRCLVSIWFWWWWRRLLLDRHFGWFTIIFSVLGWWRFVRAMSFVIMRRRFFPLKRKKLQNYKPKYI